MLKFYNYWFWILINTLFYMPKNSCRYLYSRGACKTRYLPTTKSITDLLYNGDPQSMKTVLFDSWVIRKRLSIANILWCPDQQFYLTRIFTKNIHSVLCLLHNNVHNKNNIKIYIKQELVLYAVHCGSSTQSCYNMYYLYNKVCCTGGSVRVSKTAFSLE